MTFEVGVLDELAYFKAPKPRCPEIQKGSKLETNDPDWITSSIELHATEMSKMDIKMFM